MAAATTNFATPPSVIVMAAKVGREEQRARGTGSSDRQDLPAQPAPAGPDGRFPACPCSHLFCGSATLPLVGWLVGWQEKEGGDRWRGGGHHRTVACGLLQPAVVEPGPGPAWRPDPWTGKHPWPWQWLTFLTPPTMNWFRFPEPANVVDLLDLDFTASLSHTSFLQNSKST